MAKQIQSAAPPAAQTGTPQPGILSHSVTKVSRRRGPRLTADQHRKLIELTAYYLSERRGFEPGYEHQDWLTAEDLVIDRSGLPVT